jgi:hypothetical protein
MLLMLSFSHRQFPIALRAFGMVLLFVVLLPRAMAQTPHSTTQDPPNIPSPPHPKLCDLSGPLLHIPSASAGAEGLLVRVSPPTMARYPKGAPIAVHMFASTPSVSLSLTCLSEQGFIEVGFLCPGGQYRDQDGTVWKSGGQGGLPSQTHWQDCVEPLADVLSFATGQLRSLEGKTIQSYVGDKRAMTENAGVVGWSFGGNLCVLAMARYGQRFPGLKWYASWESPILGPVDGGPGTVFENNPYYDPKSGKIDFDRLKYSPEMSIWVWPVQGLPRQPNWPHGGLYLDGDGDGVFNRDHDYGFWVDVEPGPPLKVFYSPKIIQEAVARKVFGDQWPSHIATQQEVEDRASRDDAMRYIPNAVKKLPQLGILIFESEKHHVEAAADHPWALAQMSAWLDAHARWVRFNPDVHYVELFMGKKPSREVQVPAGRRLDREVIGDLVEPEDDNGGPSDKQGMTAVACELADRTYLKNWAPVLNRVLVQQKPKVR